MICKGLKAVSLYWNTFLNENMYTVQKVDKIGHFLPLIYFIL